MLILLHPQRFYVLVLIFSVDINSVFAKETPLVIIPRLGKVEGTTNTTLNNNTFFSFEGVPYASSPVGPLRFKAPRPPKPWQGVREAKTIYKCTQNYEFTPAGENPLTGQEDCLYLNIYTPTLDVSANLDVLVYFHGGGFMFYWGGGHKPNYILDKKIIYINLNYRLGALGFLSTEDDVVPGNNGLRDQIAALQWIEKYIKCFGGNPKSITIGGFSAGSASVNFHFLSPKSRNLFHRGLCQSGALLNPWALTENALEKTKKLASLLECPTKPTKSIITCLKQKSAYEITAAMRNFQPFLYNPFTPFGPVVDSWSKDPVLPIHPYKLLKDKKVADLPMIASYTNAEGLYPAAEFYADDEYLEEIDTRWNEVIPFILDFNYTVKPKLKNDVSAKIRKYYLDDKAVNNETFMDFVEIMSDRLYIRDIRKTYKLLAKANESPIYFYHFTYRGANSNSEEWSGSDRDFGAAHADDTNYIFKTAIDTLSTEEDRQMVERFLEIVASFVKTGKPNVPTEWPPLKPKEEITYLNIAAPDNLTLQVSNMPSESFWDSLPIRENEKLFS